MADSNSAQRARKLIGRANGQGTAAPDQSRKYFQKLLIELTNSKSKLEEYRVRTEAMINSLGEGLIVTDEQGKITTVNPYALNTLGYEAHELIGTWFPKSIVAVDQRSQPISQLDRPIIHALTTGQAVSNTMLYRRKDGGIIPVFITVSPILINDQPSGAIEVFRDLTEEKRLDIAKDEFVSLASHQLRTPATGVKLILAMLGAGDFGPLTPTQSKYLEKAIRSNDRQIQIIEDLLNAARVDSGKMELEFEPCDLVTIVRDAVSEHLSIIQSRQQMLQLKSPKELHAPIDSQKIRMVVDNLLSNASKYSAPGSKLEINIGSDDNYATLSFKDYGVGMAQDDIVKVFTKFTRLRNELSTSVGGTGLGLFLVKNIVELHNGTIIADSEEGIGSTFTVHLPMRRSLR